MPLPLIPLLLGGAGLFGAGKLAGSYLNNDEARKINADARELVDHGEDIMETAQNYTAKSLASLGEQKVFILEGSIKNFINIFSRIKDVKFETNSNIDELKDFQLDDKSFNSLHDMSNNASLLSGAGRNILTAFGAYSAVSMLSLSSSAIISNLGGAAAGATLSFLGGGTIAAGVTSVLGGVLTAPVLAVLGIFLESSSSRNLEDARSNKIQALKFLKEIEISVSACNGIRKMSYMFWRLLMRLDILLSKSNEEMKQIINKNGTDYKNFSPDEKKSIAASASLAKAVKTILDTPILTEDGKLTQESLTAANAVRGILPE